VAGLHTAPLLANQQTPADYDHYIAARTETWKTAKTSGNPCDRRAGQGSSCWIWVPIGVPQPLTAS
jgi:hypothetical protein